MSKEAMQMALEALEQLQGGCTDHDDGTVEAITVWCPEVIDALREALAQPAQQPLSDERAEFEAWIPTLDAIPDLERDEDGYYQSWACSAHGQGASPRTERNDMSIEIVQAIGIYIVMPLVFLVAVYLISKL